MSSGSSAHGGDGSKDKVILEGWWHKSGKKGYLEIGKGKNRYFVLTERYLDWYKKPGEPRAGSLGLESLYLRIHTDNQSLIVGNLVQKGKEFQLSTESGDGRVRAKQWYDQITKTIDEYKDLKRAGFKKQTEVEGKKSELPDVGVPEKKQVVVEKKLEDVKPNQPVVSETRVTQEGNTTITTKTEINPFGGNFGNTSAAPSPSPAHYDPFNPASAGHHSPNPTPYGAGHHSPAATPNPYGAGHHSPAYSAPVAAPVNTFVTGASPYGAYPQATFVQPVVAPVVQPVYAMPTPVVSPMMHQCMFCRQVFQKPPTPMFGCPFCGQVNQAAQAVVTTTYAAPVYY